MSEIENQAGVATTATDHLRTEAQTGGRLDVFSDARRRRVLVYLAETDAPVSLDELVVTIAASEAECAPHALDEAATKRVAIALHHVHFPKLLQEGYVRAAEGGLTLTVDESALDSL